MNSKKIINTENNDTEITQTEENGNERMFSQDEVNKIVSDRLARDRATRTANTDTEHQTELEALRAQLKAANETNAQLKTTNLKQRIAAETGFPLAFADQLAGDTEDAIRKNACGLLKATQPKYQPVMPRKDPDAKLTGDPLKQLLDGTYSANHKPKRYGFYGDYDND